MRIQNNANLMPIKLESLDTKTDFKNHLNLITNSIKSVETQWNQVQSKSIQYINSLPQNARPLISTQILINDLSLKAQMITKVGEAVSSTIRKIQQTS